MIKECVKCGSEKISVTNTMPKGDCIWRSRFCRVCGNRFSTREILVEEYDSLVKSRMNVENLIEDYLSNLPRSEKLDLAEKLLNPK